ncbi:MAG: hypothetical protein V1710_00200 [Candidatus Bathyarchaeota archaeon]
MSENNSHTGGGEYSLTPEQEAFNQSHEKWKQKQGRIIGELSREEVCEIYSKTIKNDEANIQVLFYGFINNYTEDDQLNFSITGPSSTGKTYLPREVLRLFPPEDIHWKGYTSPKAYYHERGILVGPDGEPIQDRNDYVKEHMEPWVLNNPKPKSGEGITEWKDERNKEASKYKTQWEAIDKVIIVDLHKKFEVHIDQPSDALQRELRPLLSHDRKEIEVSITDRGKDGQNRTKKVIIRGYPTTISSSVANLLDEQEQTRHIQISPETTQEKFTETLKAQSKALANPRSYKEEIEGYEGFELLRQRIRLIKDSPVENVIIRDEDREGIYIRFIEKHPFLRPRHQRDFPRIIGYIKAHALFNQWTREHTEDVKTIYANEIDIECGFKILEPLLESNELGIPPHEYKFYVECLKPKLDDAENGLHRNDVAKMYYDFYKTRIGQKRRDKMIELYLETGLINEETDPNDKRTKRIYSTPPVCENKKRLTQFEKDQLILGIVTTNPDIKTDDIRTQVFKDHKIGVNEVNDTLNLLIRDGAVFNPRPGVWRLV